MSSGWLLTARRIVPRLARLSREIRPTYHLGSVRDLDASRLRSLGIEAVLWDVDGTLMAHHATRVDPDLARTFESLLASDALQHVIVSNCLRDRFEALATIFPGVPVVTGYETGDGAAFVIRRDSSEEWSGAAGAENAFARGASGEWRAIRKPSRRLVGAALGEVGLADRPEAALMVGDQYFTDIASANLAKMQSAKVPTLHRSSFPATVRNFQRIEEVLFRLTYGRPVHGFP